MRKLHDLLRDRGGMTLVELLVAASLLCVVITMFAAALRPAAETTRRIEDLNNAQIIADDLLETLRGEIENAQTYIKFYPSGSHIAGDSGAATGGSSIEFKNSDGFAVLLSAEGCADTAIVRTTTAAGTTTAKAIAPGYLIERWYRLSTDNTYTFSENGTPTARALTAVYDPKGFYMGFTVKLDFSVDYTPQAAKSVTATVTVYRGGTQTSASKMYSDSLVIDLRYSPKFTNRQTTAKAV